MKDRFPLYPDDRSNSFGRANELNKSGGLFDSYKNDKPKKRNQHTIEEDVFSDERTAVPSDDHLSRDRFPEQPEKTEAVPVSSGKSEKNAPDKKGVKGGIIITAAVFLGVVALAVVYFSTHAILGELFGRHEIYSSGTTEINLSGSDYNDYSQLSKLKSLEVVDLTNSPFYKLSDLYGCKNLKKVILADRVLSPENCIEFYKRLPNAHLVCRVEIDGVVYDSGLTELKLNAADPESLKQFVALDKLEEIDMTAADIAADTLKSAYELFPDCRIVANVVLNGSKYKTDIEQLKLKGELTQRDAELLGFFRNLKTVNVVECKNPEVLDQFMKDHPDIRVSVPLNLLDKTVGTEDEFVDLRGKKYSLKQVQEALEKAVPKMKSLKKIDMCGCGLSNKEMEKLCDAYPDIKFVWVVHFGPWHLRTDAVAFAALNSNGQEFYTQAHYAPLFKYCTDLRALDLGHSLITDISAISSLKKLRAVILTDNKITDIAAFSELQDLEFIEINATNKVKTLEPLRNLKNLRYVNFWSSVGINDLSPLYNHEKLEIAIFDRAVAQEERDKFISSNPNCNTFFYVDYNQGLTTTKEWRENPYRVRLKKMFRTEKAFFNWKYVTGFDETTGEYIVDYNTDQYKYM